MRRFVVGFPSVVLSLVPHSLVRLSPAVRYPAGTLEAPFGFFGRLTYFRIVLDSSATSARYNIHPAYLQKGSPYGTAESNPLVAGLPDDLTTPVGHCHTLEIIVSLLELAVAPRWSPLDSHPFALALLFFGSVNVQTVHAYEALRRRSAVSLQHRRFYSTVISAAMV